MSVLGLKSRRWHSFFGGSREPVSLRNLWRCQAPALLRRRLFPHLPSTSHPHPASAHISFSDSGLRASSHKDPRDGLGAQMTWHHLPISPESHLDAKSLCHVSSILTGFGDRDVGILGAISPSSTLALSVSTRQA